MTTPDTAAVIAQLRGYLGEIAKWEAKPCTCDEEEREILICCERCQNRDMAIIQLTSALPPERVAAVTADLLEALECRHAIDYNECKDARIPLEQFCTPCRALRDATTELAEMLPKEQSDE